MLTEAGIIAIDKRRLGFGIELLFNKSNVDDCVWLNIDGEFGRQRLRDEDEVTDGVWGGEDLGNDSCSDSGDGEDWAIFLARYSW